MEKVVLPRTALAAFLKYPQPGLVKTRLARDVGEQAAASFYLEILLAQLEMLEGVSSEEMEIHLCCDPCRSLADYQQLLDSFSYPLTLQKGRTVAERLSNCFVDLLPDCAGVVVIGTDCPALSPRHLSEARAALALGADVVLGPARDGGYYLVGMTRFHPELFEEIPWGTREVYATTRHRARLLGLNVRELEMLRDIDTWEDLKMWTRT